MTHSPLSSVKTSSKTKTCHYLQAVTEKCICRKYRLPLYVNLGRVKHTTKWYSTSSDDGQNPKFSGAASRQLFIVALFVTKQLKMFTVPDEPKKATADFHNFRMDGAFLTRIAALESPCYKGQRWDTQTEVPNFKKLNAKYIPNRKGTLLKNMPVLFIRNKRSKVATPLRPSCAPRLAAAASASSSLESLEFSLLWPDDEKAGTTTDH
uniref:Uncharacterized protein n=1 Tax=Romanomermis culicivorax TaxID=13658 RepID=A0A915HXS5_ROMCU